MRFERRGNRQPTPRPFGAEQTGCAARDAALVSGLHRPTTFAYQPADIHFHLADRSKARVLSGKISSGSLLSCADPSSRVSFTALLLVTPKQTRKRD